MPRRTLWTLLLMLVLGGCDAFGGRDQSHERERNALSPPIAHPTPIMPLQPPVVQPTVPAVQPMLEVVIPHDDRPAVQAETPPPPISGGTLLITAGERFAVAADPDRDRVSIVDLSARDEAPSTIALEAGDEPGRMVEDDAGRVHVALRRGGAVVSIDVATRSIVGRRDVCGNPRGMAFDASTSELVVACADGQLLSVPSDPASSAPARTRMQGEPDLRDVVIAGARTWVSRFKRAELSAVDARGSEAVPSAPHGLHQFFPEHIGAAVLDSMTPTFAWRTVRASDGSLFMLHQESRDGVIDLEQPTAETGAVSVTGPYGGQGGTVECGGVVQSALTHLNANGVPLSTVRLPGVLPVDAAITADGSRIAVVFAGAGDPAQQQRSLQVTVPGTRLPARSGAAAPAMPSAPPPSFSVSVFDTQVLSSDPLDNGQCLQPSQGVPVTSAFEPIAVAALGTGFVVQLREPAQLLFVTPEAMFTTVDLGGDSVADTGHQLFHHDAGGGVACASCHAEGGEDGHVWHFSGFGPRRTQALNVGLEGTAPFHWGGDMPGMPELMEEVLVTRMGGVHESSERQAALQHWLFALRAPTPIRASDDDAATRGKALFDGDAQCASCHSGEKLTDNMNVDVGTGERVQVPSLVGVGYRGPWLHTGCASTLRDRFDPECGGENHGKTAELSDAQLDDLVAYLESL